MSFKENLLKKIELEQLAQSVLASIGPAGGERKLDRLSVRKLLEMGPYRHQRERDLDLFIHPDASVKEKIIVLDNELAMYDTTVEDVGLRKSPTVKEMVKIRNAIKILRDSDVVVGKRAETLNAIKAAAMARLDLTFTTADLGEIEQDGVIALERGKEEAIIESIRLFAELLDYVPAPKAFQTSRVEIYGERRISAAGFTSFGPMALYHTIHNTLKLIEEPLQDNENSHIKRFLLVVSGKEPASQEGADVFAFLKTELIRQRERAAQKGYIFKA